MGKFVDLTGQRFGRLTVIKKTEKNKYGGNMFLCKCECGNTKKVTAGHLNDGSVRSCGCLIKNTPLHSKHGKSYTRIYYIFIAMKARCYNYNNEHYKDYGARGIKVCDKWLDKENGFMNFYNWAINNGYQEDLTIDRIDVNGNYEPDNCRWATKKEQANNRRNNHYITYNDETHTLKEWSKILKINYATLKTRIRKKYWNIEKIFTTPSRKGYTDEDNNKLSDNCRESK